MPPERRPPVGGAGGCGCLAGLREWLGAGSPDRAAQPSSSQPGEGPTAGEGELRRQVEALVLESVAALEDSMANELRGAIGRIEKAKTAPAPLQKTRFRPFERQTSPCVLAAESSAGAAPEDEEEAEEEGRDGSAPARRGGTRRWTVMCDGKESLQSILLRGGLHEDLLFSTQGTPSNNSAGNSPRHSLTDIETARRVSEVGKAVRIVPGSGRHPDSDDAQGEGPLASDQESTPKKVSGTSSPHSSLGWRVDALDLGDRLAAMAAAKKGSASVDSIVDLVQSERERWADEKQALEARLDELKAKRQLALLQRPDAEKEALKKQLADLRQAMKARSRFGAWVCERHMQESDDEEEAEQPRSAEKEALRQQMAALQAELRQARIDAGCWDSDQSPSSSTLGISPRSAIRGARAASSSAAG